MPRWKATEQIINLRKDGEVFDENWMNYDSIFQYMPEPTEWTQARPPRVDEIDIWEVIIEMGGPVGVYAAWMPHAELYIVTRGWRIVQEFSGWMANARLEKYLQANSIPYPKGPDAPVQEFVPSKLILA
jgi:hypothetical protein